MTEFGSYYRKQEEEKRRIAAMVEAQELVIADGVVKPGDVVYDASSADCVAITVGDPQIWPFGLQHHAVWAPKPSSLYTSRDDAFKARIKALADEMLKARAAYWDAVRRHKKLSDGGGA